MLQELTSVFLVPTILHHFDYSLCTLPSFNWGTHSGRTLPWYFTEHSQKLDTWSTVPIWYLIVRMSPSLFLNSQSYLTLLQVSELAYPVTLLRDGRDLKFYKGHSPLMLGAWPASLALTHMLGTWPASLALTHMLGAWQASLALTHTLGAWQASLALTHMLGAWQASLALTHMLGTWQASLALTHMLGAWQASLDLTHMLGTWQAYPWHFLALTTSTCMSEGISDMTATIPYSSHPDKVNDNRGPL